MLGVNGVDIDLNTKLHQTHLNVHNMSSKQSLNLGNSIVGKWLIIYNVGVIECVTCEGVSQPLSLPLHKDNTTSRFSVIEWTTKQDMVDGRPRAEKKEVSQRR